MEPINPQTICDQYTNDLFGWKYLGSYPEFAVAFEAKTKLDLLRIDIMNEHELSWIRNDRGLKWDEFPDFADAINKYIELNDDKPDEPSVEPSTD